MAEYLSKGTGVTLGTLGTIGFGLSLLNGNGNGLLGGLFGGGMNQAAQIANATGLGIMAEKDAEIAKLRAEKYSDKNDVEVYAQTRRENQELGDRILGNWVKPLAQEAAANRERIAVLETQVNCDREKAALREQILTQRIDCCADKAAAGIAGVTAGLARLGQVVDSITALHIPTSVICPEVMPRWNAWEAPTNQAPATQPVTGTVNVSK